MWKYSYIHTYIHTHCKQNRWGKFCLVASLQAFLTLTHHCRRQNKQNNDVKQVRKEADSDGSVKTGSWF